jgi:hypothetical protein
MQAIDGELFVRRAIVDLGMAVHGPVRARFCGPATQRWHSTVGADEAGFGLPEGCRPRQEGGLFERLSWQPGGC